MSSSAGIMQPYFLPYIGYFQLIGQVGTFVIYDNIKYTKKGWINRNRILLEGRPATITLPLKNGPDHLEIGQRQIADSFRASDILNKISAAYRKAPFYEETYGLLKSILDFPGCNLFDFLRNSIVATCLHLGLGTRIVSSSEIETGSHLRGQDRVVALCQALGASTYLNPIGGKELYSSSVFEQAGIQLRFLKSNLSPYTQCGQAFIEALSIIDVLCFNGRQVTASLVGRDFRIES